MYVRRGRGVPPLGGSSSPLEGRLIFVVGARRSGTNWIQRIVCAHPDTVAVPNETYLFSHGVAPLSERIHHGAAGSFQLATVYMNRDRYQQAMRRFCDEIFGGLLDVLGPTARYLVERTPAHAMHLDVIRGIYPDARVIHIIRDGRDVVRSHLSMWWNDLTMREAAAQWRESVERARAEASGFMTYVETRYEELLRSPHAEIEALYDALDLETTPDILESALAEATVPYNADPKMPEVATGKWRETLSKDDLAVFRDEAGETLRSLGYAEDESSVAPPRRPEVPRPAGSRVRAGLRRLRASLRPAPMVNYGQIRERANAAQRLTDELLSAVAARDWAEITGLLDPLVYVSVVEVAGQRRARGERGIELLMETLKKDLALQGQQMRADVHPGAPVHAVVLTGRLQDGTVADRALFVSSEGATISRLSYYAFPLTR